MCSRCRQNLKFENFTLSFGRLRQRIELKCVPHVQHDYFPSFNQSDHCFLALSLPLPSSLLKLPIFKWRFRCRCRRCCLNSFTHKLPRTAKKTSGPCSIEKSLMEIPAEYIGSVPVSWLQGVIYKKWLSPEEAYFPLECYIKDWEAI